jgi:hypothetical protein
MEKRGKIMMSLPEMKQKIADLKRTINHIKSEQAGAPRNEDPAYIVSFNKETGKITGHEAPKMAPKKADEPIGPPVVSVDWNPEKGTVRGDR